APFTWLTGQADKKQYWRHFKSYRPKRVPVIHLKSSRLWLCLIPHGCLQKKRKPSTIFITVWRLIRRQIQLVSECCLKLCKLNKVRKQEASICPFTGPITAI